MKVGLGPTQLVGYLKASLLNLRGIISILAVLDV